MAEMKLKTKELKAIILAAGKGTRMKSQTPKVLHKILGKTLLERVISKINKINIEEAFIIIGHQSEKVKENIEQLNNNKLTCVLQEPQLGTGHAVFKCYDYLKNFDGEVIVLCADTPLLDEKTLEIFINRHYDLNADISVMSCEVSNPTNYGRILRSENGNIQKIIEEKDATSPQKKINEINTGVYCFNWKTIAPSFSQMTQNNAQGEYYLTDIIEWANKCTLNVAAINVSTEEEIFGINTKKDLSFATKILNDKKLESLMEKGVNIVDVNNTWISPETEIEPDCTILPGCYIEGTNYIAANSTIGPNVYITGNVNIGLNNTVTMSKLSDTTTGSNCSIGPFANVRNNVSLDSNVRIGNFVEVKNSSIHSNTNAAHLSYIGDAEVGSNVNIGAGTITANYDAITKQKSKTNIKDNVKIGSNSVLVAPVTINESANVAAGSVITKDVPKSALAIARQRQTVLEGWVDRKSSSKIQKQLTNS